MTLNATWNHYIGTLLAELPALAAQVATRGHERSHEALEKSHGPRRQHLLALAHVLRAESGTFADTLAAALRQQVQAGLEEPADERSEPPASERPRRRQALSLSLVDDQQLERDIELARTIQLIESSAEWELRELQALCATLRRARSIRPEHNPLQPQMCANALLSTLQDIGLSHEARVVALQLCGQPLADAMRELCAQHCRLLRRRGVQAQDYRVRTAAPTPRAAPRAERDGALRGLAERMTHADRRSTEPSAVPTQDHGMPSQLVARLLEQIADQAEMNGSMRALLARLRVPVVRAADAETLFSLDHPVWRLVDRIASLSSVNDGRGDGGLLALARLLEPIVATLEQTERPDTGAFEEALNQVGEATIRLNSARLPPLPEPDIVDIDLTSSPPRNAPVELNAPPTHAVDAVLRRSVASQLRGTAAPPALRQFLLGPWVVVMAQASVRDGAQSPRAMRWQNAVGEFIEQAEAAARTREQLPASAALLELAEQGMQSASIPPHQLQSSLVELRCVLLHEPSPEELAPAASRHDDQPTTVPMDMVVTDAQTPAKQDRAAWLAGLMPGDLCRLFIQGRWMNAQLTWRSGNGQFCVFASRHGGRLHSLTRRQLARLRAEGLAATIERGQQVREAVDTLTRDLGPVNAMGGLA